MKNDRRRIVYFIDKYIYKMSRPKQVGNIKYRFVKMYFFDAKPNLEKIMYLWIIRN